MARGQDGTQSIFIVENYGSFILVLGKWGKPDKSCYVKKGDSNSCPKYPRKLQENRFCFTWEFQLLIQTQKLPLYPQQILKFTWPPLLRICRASLNILYEGACRVGLAIQLNSCLICLAEKKKKNQNATKPNKNGNTHWISTYCSVAHLSWGRKEFPSSPTSSHTNKRHNCFFFSYFSYLDLPQKPIL